MRRKNVIIFSLVAITAFCLFSCGKKEAPATVYDRLPGRWKLAKVGSDDNGNGNVDAFELHPVATGQDNELLFNRDGTGMETDTWAGKSPITLAFKWQVVKGDSVWLAYAANDTLTYFVASVSSSALTLFTYGNISLEEFYYTKK